MTNNTDKLVLGTVQLGMKYGVNNSQGQPTQEEAFSILDTAYKNGIKTFDTASAYGTAEEVLGTWITLRKNADQVRIISKMKPHAMNEYPDGTPAIDIVRTEVEQSLKRLGVRKLDGYLFHSPYYIYITHMVEAMQKVKEEGLVDNIGVSVYDEPEALKAAELGIDYVQVPYSVFDQRLDRTNFFDSAKKNNVTVFARSAFLQGVLLMPPEALPTHLSILQEPLKTFIRLAKEHDLTQAEAAFAFANNIGRADYLVFGVDSKEQLEEQVQLTNAMDKKVNAELLRDFQTAFIDLDRAAINPSMWSKLKPSTH